MLPFLNLSISLLFLLIFVFNQFLFRFFQNNLFLKVLKIIFFLKSMDTFHSNLFNSNFSQSETLKRHTRTRSHAHPSFNPPSSSYPLLRSNGLQKYNTIKYSTIQ